MAKFTIDYSQASPTPSSTGVHGSPDLRTGQDAMIQALGDLGDTISSLGAKLYEKQGIAEATQKLSEANESYMEMRKDLAQETDPDEYWRKFNETSSRLENVELKNGIGRERYKAGFAAMKQSQAAATLSDWERQINENYEWAAANRQAQAIENNNIEGYRLYLQNEVDAGRRNEDEAEVMLATAEKQAKARAHTKVQQAMSTFAYDSPETVLSWKGTKDMLNAFPDAKPTDMTWIRGVAQDALRAQREVNREIRNDVLKKAQTMSTPDFQKMLQQTAGISEVERTELMELFLSARKLWNNTGVNPWTTTSEEGYKILSQLLMDIRDGKINTPQEIDHVWLDGGVKFAFQEWENAQSALKTRDKPAANGYTLSHPIMRTYIGTSGNIKLLDAPFYNDENELVDPEGHVKAIATFEDYAKSVWGEPGYAGKLHDFYEQLTGGKKEENVRKWLSGMSGIKWMAKAPFRFSTPGILYTAFTDKSKFLPLAPTDSTQGGLGKSPIYVNSKEEIKALEKGTVFIYQGKNYVRD